MDWTFWAGLAGIVLIWGVTQWAFSFRTHAERRRGRDAEQADAIIEVERQRERGHWGGGI